MMGNKKKGKHKKISFNEISQSFENGLLEADKERLLGLEGLMRLRKAKAGSLKREKERLIKKLGMNDPRVKKLEIKEKRNERLTKNLGLEVERTKTDVSSFDKEAWNLWGYVRDMDFNPLPNLTVALYDEKGKWVKPLGYACTDERGFFSSTYSQKEIPELMKLFIYVSDRNHKILYKDEDPLYPSIGTIDTREIYIIEGVECTPPGPPRQQEQPGPGEEEPGPTPDSQEWKVKGIVKDEKNKPIKGITIALYDNKDFSGEPIRTGTSGKDGTFKFIFKGKNFQALLERQTLVYLKVIDSKGKIRYSSEEGVSCEPGGVAFFDLQLPPKPKQK